MAQQHLSIHRRGAFPLWIVVAGYLAVGFGTPAAADDFDWIGPGFGFWDNPAVWSATPRTKPFPGFPVPPTPDTVTFNGPSDAMHLNDVFVDFSPLVSRVAVQSGDFMFDFGDLSFNPTSLSINGSNQFVIGQGDGNIAWLTIDAASSGASGQINANGTIIGDDSGSTGLFYINASTYFGATSALNDTNQIVVGNSGTGSLYVTGSATAATTGTATIANNLDSSGYVEVADSGSTFDANWINVGHNGQGTMYVHGGGVASSQNDFAIGTTADGVGSVSVVDAGSKVEGIGWMDIGQFGQGTLAVGSHGLATAPAIYFGGNTGASGEATVGGEGAQMTAGWLDIGGGAHGKLTVNAGGTASSSGPITLGDAATADGTAVVNGPSASLQAAWSIDVGYNGQGTLTVDNGGQVAAQNGVYLGNQATGVGDATVGGSGLASSLSGVWGVTVGNLGQGTLTVNNGGTVSTPGTVTVAYDANSQGTLNVNAGGSVIAGQPLFIGANEFSSGAATVSGDNALLQAGWYFSIGNNGAGSLTVQDGGYAHALNALNFGDGATGHGTGSVSGTNTSAASLQSDWGMNIGNYGYGSLDVGAYGTANALQYFDIGTNFGSEGHVTVSGASASVQAGWGIDVGYAGTATLTVDNGGAVAAQGGITVGNTADGNGQATVGGTGTGTVLQVQGDIVVGNAGTGKMTVNSGATASTPTSMYVGNLAGGNGTLNVNAGGALVAGNAMFLGNILGSTGEATVGGANASLHANWYMSIGGAGTGTLTVTDDGTARADDGISIGAGATGVGHATVGGSADHIGTIEADWGMLVGDAGSGTLTVNSYGLANVLQFTNVANSLGGHGDVTVSGPGATLQTGWSMSVGTLGTGTLTVDNGGTVAAQNNIIIGDGATGVGTATVGGTGTGSSLSGVWDVIVGNSAGSQGTLNVGAGGSASSPGPIYIGNYGQGELHITGGGTVAVNLPDQNSGAFYIGTQAGSNGQATVSGNGSTLQNTLGYIAVGLFGTGTLSVSNGGAVSTPEMAIGAFSGAGDGQMTVTGTGSNLTVFSLPDGGQNQGAMIVGGRVHGSLTISDHATTTSPVIHVGEQAGSVGQFTVNTGGTLQATQYLNVGTGYNPNTGVNIGPSGGAGTLTVAAGSSASVAVQLLTGNAGTVDLSTGGSVTVGNVGLATPAAGSVLLGAGGTLSGTGTILGNVASIGGSLTPGFNLGTPTPGTLTLGSNTLASALTLDGASTLNYLLGAPNTVGGGVNSLTEVHGNLVLDGTLNITGLAGFAAGQYRLFDYTGSLIDQALTIGTVPSGFAVAINTSTVGQVKLDVVKTGTIDGDVNGDGRVDLTDLTLVASYWNRQGNHIIGDANNDGRVNLTDLTKIASNWHAGGGGSGTSLSLGGENIAAVPEPSAVVLAGLGLCLLLSVPRRALRR